MNPPVYKATVYAVFLFTAAGCSSPQARMPYLTRGRDSAGQYSTLNVHFPQTGRFDSIVIDDFMTDESFDITKAVDPQSRNICDLQPVSVRNQNGELVITYEFDHRLKPDHWYGIYGESKHSPKIIVGIERPSGFFRQFFMHRNQHRPERGR